MAKKSTTPSVTEADVSSGLEEILGNVIGDFNSARKYIKDSYQSVWDDCFKSYNGIRSRRGYSGVADDFTPETFSIVESLKASIAGSKPKFKFVPLREDQEQDTNVINQLVDYYWSQNNMTEKMLNWVGDMIVYGNGVFYISWSEDRPYVQHIPLSDFFVDPAATHMNRPEDPGYPRYAGYRYLTSLRQLQDEMVPGDGDILENKYINLNDINQDAKMDDSTDKDRKEMFLGSTYGKDAVKEQVEVVVYYTAKKKIMIANRSTVIFNEDNPYQRAESTRQTKAMVNGEQVNGQGTIPEIRGFLPFAILRNYVDSSLFFARGDVEVILPTQEALNDTASQKRDNLAYVLNNMWQIDPRFKHLAEQIESEPGAIFPIPKGALTPLEKQDISGSADLEIQRLTQSMRSATAADAAVQGISQKFSRTTATEVQAQLNQASMRFTTKVQTLEDEGFAQLARIIFKMMQIFVTDKITVRQLGPIGVTWLDFDPKKYWGEYQPRVILESTANAEKTALAQSISAVLQFGLNNPLVNQAELLKQAFTAMLDVSEEEIAKLLSPPAAPMMGPDGQAVDPSLTQGNATLTPGAHTLMTQDPNTPTVTPESKQLVTQATNPMSSSGYNSFSNTTRGKSSQSGRQGGGGAATASNNAPKPKKSQPSTALHASSKAKSSKG